MKKTRFPKKRDWAGYMQRPKVDQEELFTQVNMIFDEIQKNGDLAVKKYTHFFDRVDMEAFMVDESAVKNAAAQVRKDLQEAIKLAKSNIEAFHREQIEAGKAVEVTAGIKCWRESRAIERVGIYVPGGSAPLFSTVLMLGVPAAIAGCKDIVLCTPPNRDGRVHPAILYAASLAGISQIYAVGGIQAIGAMTFGTGSIPKVDKIFGPGNQYVTAAKQVAQNHGVAIDMPAGPSELLVIADKTGNAAYIAADLLSQAEHGPDSQVILLSDNPDLVDATLKEIEHQIKDIPRKDVAAQSLQNSNAIVLKSIEECLSFSNRYAPEHLILAVQDYEAYIPHISNAGSVFLGNYSCESAGDYATGTNHTLPTNGYARNYSGVSLDSFVKKITFQHVSSEGLKRIGPAVEIMAEAEQLQAHKNAVSLRLRDLLAGK